MRCYICDKSIAEPEYDRDHKQWNPCQECLDVIADTVGAFTDRPAASEEDFGNDLPDYASVAFYLTNIEKHGIIET